MNEVMSTIHNTGCKFNIMKQVYAENSEMMVPLYQRVFVTNHAAIQ